jgi:hypothetical protein
MGRIGRVVAIGCLHHVTQRGNFRREVFLDDEDRLTYLALLGAAATDAQLRVGVSVTADARLAGRYRPAGCVSAPSRRSKRGTPSGVARLMSASHCRLWYH